MLEAPPKKRPKLAETWWRHLSGIVACLVALFPVWFVASAAFNADQSVSGTSYLPTHFTLHNFGNLLHNSVIDPSSRSKINAPFLHWFGNTLVDRRHHCDLHGAHLGDGRVRVQPLPLPRPPDGHARAAADPDVPGSC